MLKLTPERRLAVTDELARWRTANQAAQKVKLYSDEWFKEVSIRNSSFNLIMQMTGLSMKRADQLCWGHSSLETYWLPDGTIRKNIADRS